MKFFDTTIQYKKIRRDIDAAVRRVITSGTFIGGTEVEKCEAAIARYCNKKYAVAVNSGTDALTLSLKALSIGVGDEVITTPFTFIATAASIVNAGATPVFVDIDATTQNIDAAKIVTAITARTKAIMPVHLFGLHADMTAINAIAIKHKLPIIEDAAQAIGVPLGEIACFSFFPSKTLGAYGDGGMIVTDNAALAERTRLLRSHGSSPTNKYENLVIGTNSRLDALQAAIISAKIKHLPRWIRERRTRAARYTKAFANLEAIKAPIDPKNNHTYHQYTIRVARRDELKKYLEHAGIPTMIYYPTPLHKQPALKNMKVKANCPVAEQIASEVLSLPLYPELTTREQNDIITKIKSFYARK